jgi:hypothetical protein
MAVAIPPQRTQSAAGPARTRLGSNRDPILDAIVLLSVLMFMVMATGFGILVLQQALR